MVPFLESEWPIVAFGGNFGQGVSQLTPDGLVSRTASQLSQKDGEDPGRLRIACLRLELWERAN